MKVSQSGLLTFCFCLQLEQSKLDDKTPFEHVNVQWSLNIDDASTDFSDEDHLEDKTALKDYYDWILNDGNASGVNPAVKNQRKPAHSRKSSLSLISNVTSVPNPIHRPNTTKSLDKRSMLNRTSSVIETSDLSFGSLRTNTIDSSNDFGSNRPPPIPPHQSRHSSRTQLTGDLNKSNENKRSNNVKTTSNHVRTISDSGLKRTGMPIRSHTLDTHSTSFNHKNGISNERGRLIQELRLRHQDNQYLQQQNSNLLHDSSMAAHSGIPTSPLPPPPQYAQRSGQTVGNLSHEQPPIIQYPSLQSNSSVSNRKQHLYGEGLQIHSAQSIESLPSFSSDELSAKYSPVPVPPPRKVIILVGLFLFSIYQTNFIFKFESEARVFGTVGVQTMSSFV